MATLNKSTRHALFFMTGDAVAILFSSFFSYLLLGSVSGFEMTYPLWNTLLFLSLSLISLGILKMYKVNWRFTSLRELFMIMSALSISAILYLTVLLIMDRAGSFQQSYLAVVYLQSILYIGAFRISKRMNLEVMQNKNHERRAVIFGAGNAGDQIMRDIKRHRHWNLNIIAVFDDAESLYGLSMHGVQIKGNRKKMLQFLKFSDIDELIIAIPSLSKQDLKSLLESVKKVAPNLKIKVLPSFHLLSHNPVGVKNIREISIDDILGREPVQIDMESLRSSISGKTVLITGAGGSIGREIVRQCVTLNAGRLITLDVDETEVYHIQKEFERSEQAIEPYVANILDEDHMNQLLSEVNADIIFHAAAYKHVPMMEEFPEEAIKVNVKGTQIIANLACVHNVEKFVLISTDKAVNPTNVMGATKRIAEEICLSHNNLCSTKFISVRFGNVLGSRGSVVPVFLDQIQKGGPVTITHPDVKRYFMTIPEAVLLVMQAGVMGKGGEVFVLDMGEPVKILDMARQLIRLHGLKPDKDIPIEFIGLRPGEKMFEELLNAEEGVIKTDHELIYKAICRNDLDKEELEIITANLLEKVKRGEKKSVRRLLKQLVPTYSYKSEESAAQKSREPLKEFVN